MDPNILIFLESLSSPSKEIVKAVRDAVLSVNPVITEKIRFKNRGNPETLEFFVRTPLAVFKFEREKLSLVFFYGAAFKDPHRLLKGSGDKLRSVGLESLETVNIPAIKDFTAQAVSYNNTYFS